MIMMMMMMMMMMKMNDDDDDDDDDHHHPHPNPHPSLFPHPSLYGCFDHAPRRLWPLAGGHRTHGSIDADDVPTQGLRRRLRQPRQRCRRVGNQQTDISMGNTMGILWEYYLNIVCVYIYIIVWGFPSMGISNHG